MKSGVEIFQKSGMLFDFLFGFPWNFGFSLLDKHFWCGMSKKDIKGLLLYSRTEGRVMQVDINGLSVFLIPKIMKNNVFRFCKVIILIY